MEVIDLVIYASVGFVMSIIGGIVGAGGGFVMTPLLIFLGLTPGQAVATGKIGGLAVTVGSLFGLKKVHGQVSAKRVAPVMALAFVIGLIVPFFIKALDDKAYRIALGVILLCMIPLMIVKKIGIKAHNQPLWKKYVGAVLLSIALFLQGVFNGGLGTLVNMVFMGMFGMTATEANLTKRWSQLIFNTTIVIGVLGSGLIMWKVAAAALVTSFAGAYIGGRLAVTKGDKFITDVMIGLILVSATWLIFGA